VGFAADARELAFLRKHTRRGGKRLPGGYKGSTVSASFFRREWAISPGPGMLSARGKRSGHAAAARSRHNGS